jgi:hypothetical protein
MCLAIHVFAPMAKLITLQQMFAVTQCQFVVSGKCTTEINVFVLKVMVVTTINADNVLINLPMNNVFVNKVSNTTQILMLALLLLTVELILFGMDNNVSVLKEPLTITINVDSALKVLHLMLILVSVPQVKAMMLSTIDVM